MEQINDNTPVIPLPDPGEGGPVADGSAAIPVIPLPDPGEGGPIYDDNFGHTPVIPLPNPGEGGPIYDDNFGNTPVIPLPNPGEGGPVNGGSSSSTQPPIWLPLSRVRFLNAAFGYTPIRVQINRVRVVTRLGYAAVSPYVQTPGGYQTITVSGIDGYTYLRKTMPLSPGSRSTIAVINTPSGLDLLQISDQCCLQGGRASNFRVSNLALNSPPLDVLLEDGRVVYADVRFKETTIFKRIRPGTYQFLFAETDRSPMPSWMDIETLDSAFLGTPDLPGTIASLKLEVAENTNYTVFLLSSGTGERDIQTMVVTDR